MEKFIRIISAVISSVVVYVFFAYVYLSFKGFVYQNGSFVLVKPASAEVALADETPVETNGIATVLDQKLALNFPKDNLIGNPDAPLTMFEFSSLGCTHCADFHLSVLPELQKDFVENGKLNVAFVSFPLEKKSMQAAMLAECVSPKNRGNYIKMAFEKQRDWMLSSSSEKVLMKYATANGLSPTAAQDCLKNDKLAEQILANRQEGIDKLKMQGTPAFLISGNGSNEIIYGVPSYEDLKSYLEKRLEKKAKE